MAGGCVGYGSPLFSTVSLLFHATKGYTKDLLVCGTTLMNVGLILTPVSIFQMSRGALVLWVGVLSVIFLRRHLWLYQWASLIIVTFGVCLVGLSGSLTKKALSDPVELLVTAMERPVDDPARVAIGVMLILFAQIFTASQYVSKLLLIPLRCAETYAGI